MRILRGLTSRLLPCGCVAGVYETYEGRVVTLLDERDAACHEPGHIEGDEIRTTGDVAAPARRAALPGTTRRR
jgi:hypothetical protein